VYLDLEEGRLAFVPLRRASPRRLAVLGTSHCYSGQSARVFFSLLQLKKEKKKEKKSGGRFTHRWT
jgi:hypothetical protein